MVALPTSVDAPQGQGFHGKLDDLHIRVAATQNTPARITTLPVSAPKIDTSSNPEDMTGDVGSVFSRNDFQGGDGLLLAHRANGDPSDATRYKSGSGIDVWPDDPGDQPSYVTLARSTELLEASGATGGQWSKWMVVHNNALYYVSADEPGTVVRHDGTNQWSGSHAAGTTLETVNGVASISGMTVHRDDVYVAQYSTGVYKRAAGNWTLVSTGTDITDGIWSVKNRLVAAKGTTLVEVPDNNDDAWIDLIVGGSTWVGVVDADAFVMAANRDGYIYALTYDPQEAAWVIQAQSQIALPEVPVAIAYQAGRVYVSTETPYENRFVGSNGAFWSAEVGADGALVDIQLIRRWEDAAPAALTVHQDYVYLMKYPDVLRYDMVSSGLHPYVTLDDTVTPVSENVVRWSMVFAPDSEFDTNRAGFDRLFVRSGGGGLVTSIPKLWATELDVMLAPQYETTGTIVLPAADFYNAEPKNWLELTVNGGLINATTGEFYSVDPTSTASISVYVRSFEGPVVRDEDWLLAGSWTWDNMGESVSLSRLMPNEQATESRYLQAARFLSVKAVLTASVPNPFIVDTHLPALFSISARAVAVADEHRFQIPVNVSDLVERPYRKAFRVRGQGELLWQALKAKEGQQVDLELYRPAITVSGVLESVDTPISGFTPRGSATTVSMLTIRGKESS